MDSDLVILPLAEEVFVQVFLDIVRNHSGYRAACSAGHSPGEGGDKADILLKLVHGKDFHRVIAAVNGSRVSAGKTGKGESGNTLVCERSRVAGIDACSGCNGEADLGAHIGDVVRKLVFG